MEMQTIRLIVVNYSFKPPSSPSPLPPSCIHLFVCIFCILHIDGTWQRALVWGLLQVLNDPLLNGVLRRLAGEVTEAVVATIVS